MTARTATGAVRIRVLPLDAIDRVAVAWRQVEALCPQVPLMVSWDWTRTWLRHYGSAVDARFVIAERYGRPRAVALLCRSSPRYGPVRVPTLHLGTAGEPSGASVCVEYNDLLCVPGDRETIVRALAATIAADRWWHELRIDGADDATLGAQLAARTRDVRVRQDVRPSWYYDLGRPAPDADIASALESGPRRRVRAGLRAFAARGPLAVDWPTDPAEATSILAELVERHQRRWQDAGEPGAFASERFVGFHREIVRDGVATGAAAVLRARCGDETIGCLYLLRDGDRALFYQSGLATFDDNRLRPGVVAHALAMQACRERGFVAYDFLAGDARYKRELSTDRIDLTWTQGQRPRLRLRSLDVARQVRNRTRPRTSVGR